MAWRRKRKRADVARVRLTLAGWLFLGGALLVGAGAVNSQASLMFWLFGAMMGVLHVSAVLSRRMVQGVTVRREAPGRVWQNRTVHLGYYLRNTRRRGSSLGLGIDEEQADGLEWATGYCLHLPRGATFRSGGRFVARRRGRIRLKDIRVRTAFPFGLVRAEKRCRQEASVVIWPARGKIKGRLLHHGVAESSRAAPSPVSGGQDEFFGLRDYRPDDNPRWIHWRRSAGRTDPVVREMTRPLPEILFVAVDAHLSDLSELGARAREKMFRFAGTLIDHAFARGYQVGLAAAYAGGVAVRLPAGGIGQRRALMDALADIDSSSRTALLDTLRHVERRHVRNAIVVVVTASDPRPAAAALESIRANCRHLSVVTERSLSSIYEDDPLAGSEDPKCR